MNHWSIEEHSGGFDVRLNSRSVAYDRSDMDEVRDLITRHRSFTQLDVVYLTDQTGYRERIRL